MTGRRRGVGESKGGEVGMTPPTDERDEAPAGLSPPWLHVQREIGTVEKRYVVVAQWAGAVSSIQRGREGHRGGRQVRRARGSPGSSEPFAAGGEESSLAIP